MGHKRFFLVLLSGFLTLFMISQGFTQSDEIKERRKLMKASSKASKAVKKAIKKSDFAAIEEKAKIIAANMEKFPDLFPEGSGEGKTRAKAAIWGRWDSFKEKNANTLKAAEEMAEAAAAKDLDLVKAKRKALKCGGCHKPFRKKKKK